MRISDWSSDVCSSDLRRGRPARPEDLAAHDCLIYANTVTPREWTLIGARGPQAVTVKGPLLANNGDVLCAAAVGGMGITKLPTFIVGPFLRDGRLEVVLPHPPVPEHGLHAAVPHSRHLPLHAGCFVAS